MSDWCILRTAPCSTLRLVQSLEEAGYEAWTPTEAVVRRARRSHPQEEQLEALMPTYVFAKFARLADLLALARSPLLSYRIWDSNKRRMVVRGHPFFRMMPGPDARFPYARVSEAQLQPLRRIADRRRPKTTSVELATGDRIRMIEGCYAGLYGTVVDCDGPFPEVQFDGWPITVRPARWLLHSALDGDYAVGVMSEQVLSAKAA
jgi:transcription antitermination factor NusG